MRAEHFEVLRRDLDRTHALLMDNGRGFESMLDVRRPWNAVFLRASEDVGYWDKEVRDTAILYTTGLKARPAIVDDGHHAHTPGTLAMLGDAGVEQKGSAKKKPEKPKSKAPKKEVDEESGRRDRRGGEDKGRGNGKDKKREYQGINGGKPRKEQECFPYMRDAAGCPDPCPNGRLHPPCPRCGKQHPHQKPCPAH